jgi:hypothetical protein
MGERRVWGWELVVIAAGQIRSDPELGQGHTQPHTRQKRRADGWMEEERNVAKRACVCVE